MYTSSPRPYSGAGVVGVAGMEVSLVESLRGLKKAMPKSFSEGFVTEAASLMVILLFFSNFVNLIELDRKLIICRVRSVTSARPVIHCTDHLEETTRVDQHMIQSEVRITLVNFHVCCDLGVFNLLLEHLQSSLHDGRDLGSFQTQNQKIRVQL